jgi:hypothetical protein
VQDLAEALATVAQRIEQYAGKGIGEQNTKNTLIAPVLRALGWEMEDLEEVQLEYKRRAMDNPVDYALFIQRSPRLFVEAKALGASVSDSKWAGQIMGYAVVAGVEWVCLTDGDTWRIYNSHVVLPVDQKLFRSVRISEDAGRAAETLSLLSRDRMQENLIDALWKAHHIDYQIKTTLERMFHPDPEPGLVRLVRKHVPDLSPAEVRAGLTRAQLVFDFPAGPSAAPPEDERPTPQRSGGQRSRSSLAGSHVTRGSGTPWRTITLGDLISAGLVSPPLDLGRTYRGAHVSARVEADGRVSFQGRRFDSLSAAAGAARVSVAGPFPGRAYPQTNGWTFWLFRDADGRLKELDLLRRRLHTSTR